MTLESNKSDATRPNDPTVENVVEKTISQMEDIGIDSSSEEWEAAGLPGTVLEAEDSNTLVRSDSSISTNNAAQAVEGQAENRSEVASTEITSEREKELVSLIHDLNECNDVLLARVSQLETALEDAHATLQKERETAKVAQNQILERVNAQQASAQQLSQNAQQQVASLVDQLESAEQGSQRQQLVNETLLAELENAKERVAQLEQECTRNAQQQAEEAQSRVAAESTIRDLRSRLQRQQRYTLQFKAALEKSLTVTARSNPADAKSYLSQRTIPTNLQPISGPSTAAVGLENTASENSFNPLNQTGAVAMPRAQQIVPWAAAQSTAPFQGIDPHLESLIRGANQSQTIQPQTVQTPSESLSDAASNPIHNEETAAEAESQLWQDLERVIEHNKEENTVNEARQREEDHTDKKGPVDEKSQVDEKGPVDQSDQGITDANVAIAKDTSATAQPKTHYQKAEKTEQKAEKTEKSKAEKLIEEIDLDADVSEPKFNWQQSNWQQSNWQQESVEARSNHQESDRPPSDSFIQKTASEAELLTAKAPADDSNTQLDSRLKSQTESPKSNASNLPSIVIDPYTVPEGQTPAAEVAFTEPSPWGKSSEESVESNAGESSSSERKPPFFEGDSTSVSPVVHPLRSQKKKNSMASVELPTFEKAKVSSFQR